MKARISFSWRGIIPLTPSVARMTSTSRMSLYSQNRWEWVDAYHGALKAGAHRDDLPELQTVVASDGPVEQFQQ